MKFFTASFGHETNAFSPVPTGYSAFAANLRRGRDGPVDNSDLMRLWRDWAERDGHVCIEGLSTATAPSGPLTRDAYDRLSAELIALLREALPVDAVLLDLHGAMAAQHCDDCEGDLLARIREIVGPQVFLGAVLDPHGNLSDQMVESADLLVLMKRYPHTDGPEQAEHLYALMHRVREGAVKPVASLHDVPVNTFWGTLVSPVSDFVDRMIAHEEDSGVLSVSFNHGFPYADVPQAGARILVYTDGRPDLGRGLAKALAEQAWDIRAAARDTTRTVDMDVAIDAALAQGVGPVVVADLADNVGAGAPGDSTFLLERLLDRGVRDAAVGMIFDPMAVEFCFQAGVGATLALRLGGKIGPASGRPLDLVCEVRALAEEHQQAGLAGQPYRCGRGAWISVAGIDIVVNDVRQQLYSPDAFTGLGISVTDKRLIVVKSTQHFRQGFDPLARAVFHVRTPGALEPDLAAAPYQRRSLDFWPRSALPAGRPRPA